MAGTLEGKVALISGSGRGIGRAIANRMAVEGARIVVNDVDAENAREVVENIRSLGGEATACIGSVTAPDFADRFIQTALDKFEGLDIVVNNAGYTWDSVIQNMTDEQWYAMIDVHMTAPFRILRAAYPVIRGLSRADRERGVRNVRRVVNVSSVSGLFGIPGQANYSAAKAGITGLTKAVAKEWGRLDTTVNCVAYGLIKTRLTEATADANATAKIAGRDIKVGVNPDLMVQMERSIPLGHAGTPEEAAGAVYMLCTPDSDYISGQVITCSGGMTGI